jgi:ketosteroid isomerase-like protein
MLRTAMSENSQLLLAGYDAWNRDDCEAWLELLHPDVEIRTSGAFPDLSPVYRGHARAVKFWHQLREPWEVFRIQVEEIDEEGDCVAASIKFRATGVDSGAEVELRFGSAIRVHDGLATELVNGRTVDEARETLRQTRPPDEAEITSNATATERARPASRRSG